MMHVCHRREPAGHGRPRDRRMTALTMVVREALTRLAALPGRGRSDQPAQGGVVGVALGTPPVPGVASARWQAFA